MNDKIDIEFLLLTRFFENNSLTQNEDTKIKDLFINLYHSNKKESLKKELLRNEKIKIPFLHLLFDLDKNVINEFTQLSINNHLKRLELIKKYNLYEEKFEKYSNDEVKKKIYIEQKKIYDEISNLYDVSCKINYAILTYENKIDMKIMNNLYDIFKNEKISFEMSFRLIDINELFAKNKNTPCTILEDLYNKENKSIHNYIIYNPNINTELTEKILLDNTHLINKYTKTETLINMFKSTKNIKMAEILIERFYFDNKFFDLNIFKYILEETKFTETKYYLQYIEEIIDRNEIKDESLLNLILKKYNKKLNTIFKTKWENYLINLINKRIIDNSNKNNDFIL